MRSKARFAFFSALAIGLLALGGWKAFSHFRSHSPAAPAVAQRYVCPMRCLGKTYDHPGKCPVCHMELKAIGKEAPQDPRIRDLWPRVAGKTAVYFRPYTVQKIKVDRLLRVAGKLDRNGLDLRLKLPFGDNSDLKKGASAMVMPPLGYARPVLATVVSKGADSTVALRLAHTLPGGTDVLAEIRVSGPEVLALPNEALCESQGDVQVFKESGQGYVPHSVSVGLRGERFVEVIDGLKEGDQVASSGVFWLQAQWRMDHERGSGADPAD